MKHSTCTEHAGRNMMVALLIIHIRKYQHTVPKLVQMIKLVETSFPPDMRSHAYRVGVYAAEIYAAWARKHDVPQIERQQRKQALKIAAILHDIGKIVIPANILNKNAQLNSQEYEMVKQHTVLGVRFFAHICSDFGQMAAQIALTHHERWDGSGYPGHVDPLNGQVMSGYADERGKAFGKRGQEIPMFGRVVAVADVFDALSSKRAYKGAWPEGETLKAIEAGAGTHFDPEMVDAFFDSIGTLRAI